MKNQGAIFDQLVKSMADQRIYFASQGVVGDEVALFLVSDDLVDEREGELGGAHRNSAVDFIGELTGFDEVKSVVIVSENLDIGLMEAIILNA